MKTIVIGSGKDEKNKQVPTAPVQEKGKTPPAQEQPKQGESKQEQEIKSLLNPSAEQRIKNARNFQLLSERFEGLQAKQDELNVFSISSDGTQDKFRLSNSKGAAFEFTNSDVIEEVIAVVRKHLDLRLERTEKEILEFTI